MILIFKPPSRVSLIDKIIRQALQPRIDRLSDRQTLVTARWIFLKLRALASPLFSYQNFYSERRLFSMVSQLDQQARLPLDVIIVGYGQLLLALSII